MTVILEEDAITEHLVEYLEADSTLMNMLNGYVNPEVVPASELGPFVRIDRLDGEDLRVVGLHRVWVDTTWHIRGAMKWEGRGRPDRTEINAVGARIDELLHDHEAVTDYVHIHSFREEAEPNPSVLEPGGEVWLQSGGIYRIRAVAL